MTSLKKVVDAAPGVPLNHYAKEIQSLWNSFYELGSYYAANIRGRLVRNVHDYIFRDTACLERYSPA